jgi:predicted component of type VI protein secretion system
VRPVIDAEGKKPIDRRVRFEIEAVLVVEPLREPVLFSTSLDVSSGEFAVEGTK